MLVTGAALTPQFRCKLNWLLIQQHSCWWQILALFSAMYVDCHITLQLPSSFTRNHHEYFSFFLSHHIKILCGSISQGFALLVQVGCFPFPAYSVFHTSAVGFYCMHSHPAQLSSVVELVTAEGFSATVSDMVLFIFWIHLFSLSSSGLFPE